MRVKDSENFWQKLHFVVPPVFVYTSNPLSRLTALKVSEYMPLSNTVCANCLVLNCTSTHIEMHTESERDTHRDTRRETHTIGNSHVQEEHTAINKK